MGTIRGVKSLLTAVVASLLMICPGDPVQIMFAQSQGTTPEQLEEVRQRLGLDQPLVKQYIAYLGRLLQGDLGVTIRGEQPVLQLLLLRLPNTLILAASALLIASVIGLTFGFIAAYKRGSWLDTFLMTTAILGVSMPHFWLGLILLFYFAVHLGWFPVAGSGFPNLVLPALTLGLTNAAIIARLTRSSMIDIFDQDFIRTAHAKGLPARLVLLRHAIKGGLLPVVSYLGPATAGILTGSLVIERIFAIPGTGSHFVNSALNRDYTLSMGVTILYTVLVYGLNTVVDLAYTFLDPRIKLEES